MRKPVTTTGGIGIICTNTFSNCINFSFFRENRGLGNRLLEQNQLTETSWLEGEEQTNKQTRQANTLQLANLFSPNRPKTKHTISYSISNSHNLEEQRSNANTGKQNAIICCVPGQMNSLEGLARSTCSTRLLIMIVCLIIADWEF